MKNKLFFLSLLIISISCDHKQKRFHQNKVINFSESDIFSLDKLVSDIEFIPLNIPDQILPELSLKGEPNKLVVNKNLFIATQSTGEKASIFKFTLDGKYEAMMNNYGQGPEEYDLIFNLLEDNGHLIIGNREGKLLYYNSNLELIKSQKIHSDKIVYSDYIKMLDGKWLTSMNNNKTSGDDISFGVIDDVSGKIDKLPIVVPKISKGLTGGHISRGIGSELLLNYSFSDTIFSFNENQTYPLFIIKPENGMPNDSNKITISKNILNQEFTFNVGTILGGEDIIKLDIFGLVKNENFNLRKLNSYPMHELYVNRNNHDFRLVKSMGMPGSSPSFHLGYFYQLLYADQILAALEEDFFGKYSNLLKEKLKNIDDAETPVIVKYKVEF